MTAALRGGRERAVGSHTRAPEPVDAAVAVDPRGPGLGGAVRLSCGQPGPAGGRAAGVPGRGDSPRLRSLPRVMTNRRTETLGLSCDLSADRVEGERLNLGTGHGRAGWAPTTTGWRGPAGSPLCPAPAPSTPPSGSSGVRADVATASRGRRAAAASDAGGGAGRWHKVRADGAAYA